MTLLDDLQWRGLVHQTTHDDLGAILEKAPLTVYAGFDPTADSLHVGHMVPLIGLARFQRAGHTPIALMGGATGMIGDPSFKSEERSLISEEQIQTNLAGIEVQLRQFLDFSGDNAAIIGNNLDWLGKLNLVTFLRDIGKHFSVNTMMSKESVRARLNDRDQGISYTEFTYQLLQAYDFLQLFDSHGCTLQIGGSDQWGNIVAGKDLLHKLRPEAETFGLTMPLITKSDGTKFGKTESGAVWLDAKRTSPYKFYQYWINTADADVVNFLSFFTFLAKEEIDALAQQVKDEPHKRAAQAQLATEMTRMVHGDDALANAIGASKAMFGGDLDGLDAATLEDVFSEVPSNELPSSTLAEGRALLEVLTDTGVFQSKGEARRMVKNGGLYLNNHRVDADDTPLNEQSLCAGNIAIIRKGKKNYHLLKFV